MAALMQIADRNSGSRDPLAVALRPRADIFDTRNKYDRDRYRDRYDKEYATKEPMKSYVDPKKYAKYKAKEALEETEKALKKTIEEKKEAERYIEKYKTEAKLKRQGLGIVTGEDVAQSAISSETKLLQIFVFSTLVVNVVLSSILINNINKANLPESNNLYYTLNLLITLLVLSLLFLLIFFVQYTTHKIPMPLSLFFLLGYYFLQFIFMIIIFNIAVPTPTPITTPTTTPTPDTRLLDLLVDTNTYNVLVWGIAVNSLWTLATLVYSVKRVYTGTQKYFARQPTNE